jgi:hypothetical protein
MMHACHPRPPQRVRVGVALLIALLTVGPLGLGEAAAKPRKKPAGASSNSGLLTIASLTRGATVFVDDAQVGEVPLENALELSPGVSHVVRLQKRGFSTFVETIKLAAGEEREIEADLVPSGGVLKVNCNVRRAQILLDGKQIGVTPFDGDIAPGKHQLQVGTTGKVSDTRVIEVIAGEELVIEIALKDVPPPTVEEDDSLLGRWWFWTAIGTAVVGGVTLGVLSQREIKVEPAAANHSITLP